MKLYFGTPTAVACVRGETIRGTVAFYPQPDGTLVVAEITGLPDTETGFFAFHIHEGGDCGGEGFSDTGGHFNPGGMSHPHHVGDLPPLLRNDGKAFLAVITGRFHPEDVIGKTAVIHDSYDDFHTQPAGNAGKKIACGEICRFFG